MVVQDDLVLAQITRSILPFIGRRDGPSLLALDQFSLILGAHLLQRYGVLQKMGKASKGGLAPMAKAPRGGTTPGKFGWSDTANGRGT